MEHADLLIHNLCNQGFHIIDNWLDSELSQSLRITAQELYEQGLFRGAKIGRQLALQQNDAIRTDKILWLGEEENNPSLRLFLEQIQQLIQILNQALFLGLHEFEMHFAIYQPGTYYKKHCDQFADQKTRKISFVYYLNPNWHNEYGGALQLYTPKGQLLQKVSPQENRFICFDSILPHEVLLTSQPRYSITGWLKTRSFS